MYGLMMKNYFFLSALAMLLATSAYGQVNLSEMEPSSADSLVKKPNSLFLPGHGRQRQGVGFLPETSLQGVVTG